MTSPKSLFPTLVATLAIISAGQALAEGEAAHLAPHRAVYEMTLDRTTPGSGVNEMTGRMVYELVGSECEGWTQNMRFVTRITGQDGENQVNDLRTSSWEEAGGRKLRFNSTQFRDEQLSEQAQGDAVRGDKGGVSVELTKPEKKALSLPAETYFPVQHSLTMLQAARAGKTGFTAKLYDGSEKGDKFYLTNTVIGRLMQPGATRIPTSVANADKLDRLNSWPISISYFEPGSEKKDTSPAYEISFRFFENGVSTKMHIDYGEFSLNGELKELTFIEASKCSPGGASR